MSGSPSPSRRFPARRKAVAIIAAAALATALSVAPGSAATAAPNPCRSLANPSVATLQACLTAISPMTHLKAFQRIADRNDGNRAANTSGYTASVDYVAKTLKKAGWKVTLDEFDYYEPTPPTVEQLAPTASDVVSLEFEGTAYAEVTAPVVGVDLALDPPRDPVTSGCEAADFAGFPVGSIALIQRGTCEFGVKAANAQAAGASGVILMNQGNTPEREALFTGTLYGINTEQLQIPVVAVSFADGVAFAAPGSIAHVLVPEPVYAPQVNVIAELPGKNKSNVVMAGAHLDSVPEGAGINDNGSGSAALLSIAQAYSKIKPQNTLRFAWWGAEEEGLIGSWEYVDGLAPEELEKIALYLNFDMIASPNYVFTVYDADQTSFEAPVEIPAGSEAIEDLFESYFTLLRVPYDDSEFNGRSDYEAFIYNGIPSGGLFTGAEEEKTPEQAAIWGGTAGEWLDPNYHAPGDDITNISKKALAVNTGAMATALFAYAYTTESVNGVKGKKLPTKFKLPAPAGPQGTFVTGGGGHEHADAG